MDSKPISSSPPDLSSSGITFPSTSSSSGSSDQYSYLSPSENESQSCPAHARQQNHKDSTATVVPGPQQSVRTLPTDNSNAGAQQESLFAKSQQQQHAVSGVNSSQRPLILYSPPTVGSILRSAAINLLLPFINGLMLGFGELFAHEAAFRLGWGGTRVFPGTRSSSQSHSIGPGIEVREDASAEYMRRRRGREAELEDLTSLE